MKIDLLSKKADYVGITGSVLCVIHCLITPVLLMTTALANDHALRDGYLSLDYVFIGINIIAVYSATRHNTSPLIKKALWGFLSLFVVALVLEEVSPIFEYLAYTASAGLVVTHFANIRYCRLKHSH
ncbi:MerC domain-containing protein [Tellurirhabdus bombi]|uniref:MerC domain-containing protein n=1 Tax=Tellurirhabdus bombi TaxID=2907205 RepID=UPI001F1B03EB|nr:MerC domain-containing protein [Tellurirhabdus bombi]